jgi:hypothetical protein
MKFTEKPAPDIIINTIKTATIDGATFEIRHRACGSQKRRAVNSAPQNAIYPRATTIDICWQGYRDRLGEGRTRMQNHIIAARPMR